MAPAACALLLSALSGLRSAHADEAAAAVAAASVSAEEGPPLRRHLVYAELLGKAGPYGVGYELELSAAFAVGGVASYAPIDGQRLLTIAPYVHVAPLRRGAHALFAEVGPVVTHLSIPSPVPEWDGVHQTDVGAQLAAGWELRSRLLLRASLGLAAGSGGVAPWGGLAAGVRF